MVTQVYIEMRTMRRALASLLLCLLTIPVIAQALAARASVPECCRRDGKHHCAMESSAAQPDGPALSEFQQKCPLYPRASTAASSWHSVLPAPSPRMIAPQSFSSSIRDFLQAAVAAFTGSSISKRGPPSLSC